eukprot:scaffold89330_cov53-Attheya_sp.AAC.1
MSYSPPHLIECLSDVSSPSSVMTPQNVSGANTFVKDGVAEFQQNMHQGNVSLLVLVLLGGISMVIVSIRSFVLDMVDLNWYWVSALFDLYTLALGALIIILEFGRQRSFFKGVESSLYENALFLKYVWGRGVLYFVVGTLQMSQQDIASVVVGLYVCVVAVTFVVVGQRVALSPPHRGVALSDVSSPSSMMTPQNVSEANTFAKDGVAEFQQNVHQGHLSLRFLVLLGGLSMVIVSIRSFALDMVDLNWYWVPALFDLYTLSLGMLIIILEFDGRQLKFFKGVESGLYKNALFLKYVWGRGVLYFVVGTLQMSQQDIASVVVGLYVCVVAITFVLVGQMAAARQLEELRRASSPHQLQVLVATRSVESKASISIEQFQNLTNNLGVTLTRQEVEKAFLPHEFDSQGRVRSEAVQKWREEEASAWGL